MGEGKGPRGGGGRGQCGDGGRIALPQPIASADEIEKCWRAAAQASAAPREDQPLTPAVAARRCRACQCPSSPSPKPQWLRWHKCHRVHHYATCAGVALW